MTVITTYTPDDEIALGDIGVLYELVNAAFNGKTADAVGMIEELVSDDCTLYVASPDPRVRDQSPLGVLVAVRSADHIDVPTIAVVKSARKSGVGSALITALMQVADLPVRLTVDESNRPALKLYARCGFKTVNTYQHYYGKGKNALRMERTADAKVVVHG